MGEAGEGGGVAGKGGRGITVEPRTAGWPFERPASRWIFATKQHHGVTSARGAIEGSIMGSPIKGSESLSSGWVKGSESLSSEWVKDSRLKGSQAQGVRVLVLWVGQGL